MFNPEMGENTSPLGPDFIILTVLKNSDDQTIVCMISYSILYDIYLMPIKARRSIGSCIYINLSDIKVIWPKMYSQNIIFNNINILHRSMMNE